MVRNTAHTAHTAALGLAGRLERISAVGPYFAVHCGDLPDADAAGFRPMTELYEDGALTAYTETVRGRMGVDQPRVAASTVQLGTASRLWSIALATAAVGGRVPDLHPRTLWWRPGASGPVELWLPVPRELPDAAADGPADAVHRTVAEANLRPLADAVHRVFGVSPHILRGNAASALIGSLRVLLARVPEADRAAALAVVRDLLGREPLAGAGDFTADADGNVAFRRRSCCLYYRVPGAGVCGDCVLTSRPSRANRTTLDSGTTRNSRTARTTGNSR
ncbi:(2Fe-2S)-binding protein [Streptomyces sp. HNM0663]|uniref:(2Fe-2S)-binding protein n=1 Tax=Streptomyces chengmaiensis TaxID=3040919 RepID=A0ABT6HQB8_9ACTN|nr:(2Fe-2S)-binding protein [Streptomyces chengmaiensis]MDH2390922.1 (2Fe-2S)-binding protein [Streptomyces chengmaiensis]